MRYFYRVEFNTILSILFCEKTDEGMIFHAHTRLHRRKNIVFFFFLSFFFLPSAADYLTVLILTIYFFGAFDEVKKYFFCEIEKNLTYLLKAEDSPKQSMGIAAVDQILGLQGIQDIEPHAVKYQLQKIMTS